MTLSAEDAELLDAAKEASKYTYNPYSGFAVGAALRLSDGSVVTGANIENASYGAVICAERAAVAHAYSQGRRDIVAIAVIAPSDKSEELTGPCGICRQVLLEVSQVAGVPIKVILSNGDSSKTEVTDIASLLPRAFGPDNLGITS